MESFDGTDADLMRNILQKQVGNNDRSYSDILHLLIAKHIKLLQAEKYFLKKIEKNFIYYYKLLI